MKHKPLNIGDISDKLWQEFYAETKGRVGFADYLINKYAKSYKLPKLSDPPLGFKTLLKGVEFSK